MLEKLSQTLELWKEQLKSYNKQTRKFLQLTERQQKLLARDRIDEFISLFERKKEIMEEIARLQQEITQLKQAYGHLVEDPHLSELRELQNEGRANMEAAVEQVNQLEQELSSRRMQLGEELKQVKTDKQTMQTYLSSKGKQKGQGGTFFDKRS